MSFQEKSAITLIGTLVIVYGAYFAIVGRWMTFAEPEDIGYQPLMIVAIVPLTILAAVSHIALAVANPKDANAYDERDKLVALRSERVGGYVLLIGVVVALILAMAELPQFYIANALMLAWVLAEITDNAVKVVRYRRGA